MYSGLQLIFVYRNRLVLRPRPLLLSYLEMANLGVRRMHCSLELYSYHEKVAAIQNLPYFQSYSQADVCYLVLSYLEKKNHCHQGFRFA